LGDVVFIFIRCFDGDLLVEETLNRVCFLFYQMDSISGGAFLLHSVSGTIDITETEGGKANLATNTPNFKVGRTSDKLNIPSLVATSHSGPIRLTVKGTTPSH
jgi:hypothetical protein